MRTKSVDKTLNRRRI